MLTKKGFEVRQSVSSSFSSREKEADTQLTADAVEDVITKKPSEAKPHGGTVVLLSGDQDMCPLIKKARNHGWHVEIWAYNDTLSTILKTEAERKVDGTLVTIKALELEEKFEKYTHTVYTEWKEGIPVDRALVVV